MRKISAFFICICATFLFVFFGGSVAFSSAFAEIGGNYVYVGGMPAGFMLSAGGAQVIGVCEVVSEDATTSPAVDAGIKTGDLITEAAGIKVRTISDLNDILAKNGEKELEITIKRGEDIKKVSVFPKKDSVSQKYKIGVLIRDSITGIGTITYIDPKTSKFGSLGHTVGEDREIGSTDGKIYKCTIVSVMKGIRGKAGELHGMFLGDGVFGMADTLCNCGIFGTIDKKVDFSTLEKAEATSSFVKPGVAYILSTVNGQMPKKYTAEIVKVDQENPENKNYVLKITDKALIEATGGIVQGMSGSPILQEGRLVGAVTHVFLNDPTRGYGIGIEKMINRE